MQNKCGDGIISVQDLKLPKEFIFVERDVAIAGPTCPICCDCCMCESGGV